MTDLGSSDGARDVAIQPDGKIVEAGKSGGTEFGGSNAALVRYLGA